MIRLVIATAAVALIPLQAHAQDRNGGFMVHQMCVATNENVAEINELSAITKPILDDLKAEGMISAWFELRHGWGDEYNVGTVTVADSHRAWLDFWSEFLARAREAEPGILRRMNDACLMHKDNMYNVRDMSVGS